jgi:site-specific DNA-methyltransferase (adenine-specific)
MKTLPDKSVDCFICDLPYGCLTGGGGKEKAKRMAESTDGVMGGCTWDIKIDLVKFWEQIKRLAKNDNTPVLMFCTTKFGSELIASNPDWFRYDLVWSKSRGVGFLSANKMPLRSHEMIYVFAKKGAYYKRVDIEGDFPKGSGGKVKKSNVYGKPLDYGEKNGFYDSIEGTRTISKEGRRCPKSVIEMQNKTVKGGHPTQKPAELYEWLLKRYCPEKGMMLDPTAGSFTSCFTANKLGIESIGIEMKEEFYEKACKELKKE